MFVPFNQLPDHARVWIYPSNRELTKSEISKIENLAEDFLNQWTSHGNDLQAGVNLPYDRFIVLGLNESIQSTSGCSIDASVRFIQSLEADFDIVLLDKMNVTFKKQNTIDYIPLNEFRNKAKRKEVAPDVIVFNNLVLNKIEYETLWEVPASSSWHSRYF
ncbi:MAG: ABC transporter ATPase [Flavobacteriaceae bacterium TMED212]|mgnify:CR=1 FL=1|nr:ABC transporter ATPase [Paracoccaceae bacterium]OUW76541.1 MAG: ABC transporter ATPase [Flavobacteriaceae bacterium TMED212]|tara:strand:+ start:2888 stop:3370 length:483 start_codon:yes stop_codon:yes gene_type:complete